MTALHFAARLPRRPLVSTSNSLTPVSNHRHAYSRHVQRFRIPRHPQLNRPKHQYLYRGPESRPVSTASDQSTDPSAVQRGEGTNALEQGVTPEEIHQRYDAQYDELFREQDELRKMLGHARRRADSTHMEGQIRGLEGSLETIDSKLKDLRREEKESSDSLDGKAGPVLNVVPNIIAGVLTLAVCGALLMFIVVYISLSAVDVAKALDEHKTTLIHTEEWFKKLSKGQWSVEVEARQRIEAIRAATKPDDQQRQHIVDAALMKLDQLQERWHRPEDKARRAIEGVREEMSEGRAYRHADLKVIEEKMKAMEVRVHKYRTQRGEVEKVAAALERVFEHRIEDEVPEEQRQAYWDAVAYLRADA